MSVLISLLRLSAVRAVALVAVLVFVTIEVVWFVRPQALLYAYEEVTYRLDPSAERAFEYGERHFNAIDARIYDLARAKYFFSEVIVQNAAHPYVFHELARIAFLEGDFGKAMALINKELATNPNPSPASYYIRALIKGYIKDYAGAALDYETYFKVTPANWAGINDYSWVLLKQDLPLQALEALDWGLTQWPQNAWLLSNKATALYELKRFDEAKETAQLAERAVAQVTTDDWLIAYPGNDPAIATEGLASFRKTVSQNAKKMEVKAAER